MKKIEDIAIHDSNLNTIKFYRNSFIIVMVAINLFVLLYCFLIAPIKHITLNPANIFYVLMILVLANSIVFIALIIIKTGTYPIYIDVLLNSQSFEVYIQKKLYMKQNWSRVESIEIIKTKGFDTQRNIKFIGDRSKIFRLNLIMLNEKKLYEVIDSVRTFSNLLNINVEDKVEKLYYNDEYKEDEKVADEFKRIRINLEEQNKNLNIQVE